MQIAVYFRVSTKSQNDSGLGLDAQHQIISHYTKGDEILKEFTEVKSGKNISERPILQEAIKFCLENNCILVVPKLDRLSRNVDDARYILEKLNGNLRCCDIPAEKVDKFTLTLFAAFGERERELIALRTKNALQAKLIRDGAWQKPSEPFKNGSANKLAVESIKKNAVDNPNNARARQIIRSLRNEGKNFTQIAKVLNDSKFQTSQGKEFHVAQVSRLA